MQILEYEMGNSTYSNSTYSICIDNNEQLQLQHKQYKQHKQYNNIST